MINNNNNNTSINYTNSVPVKFFSSLKNNLRKNIPSYIVNMDNKLQNELLDYILSQPLSVISDYKNILYDINSVELVESKIDILSFDTPYSDAIIKIINANFLKNEDKQFLIEKFALEYELNFFKYHLDQQSYKAVHVLFKECHSKLIKCLDILIEKYTVANYKYIFKQGITTETKIAIFLMI